jgi:hypothetical protein
VIGGQSIILTALGCGEEAGQFRAMAAREPHAGLVHFDMEDGAGKPSRWNTHWALRVYWTGIQHEPSANTPGRRPGLTVMIATRIALV